MADRFAIAFRAETVKRAARVALLVGPILTLINQGDVLLNGPITAAVMIKVPLTFCVPFAVSTYASVEATLETERQVSRNGTSPDA